MYTTPRRARGAGAVDTRAVYTSREVRRRCIALLVGIAVHACVFPALARAQSVNGSMQMDYQTTKTNAVADGRLDHLVQQYFIRAVDRLFVKNTVIFTGNFAYRTGGDGQPVDFHSHYEWLLSSYAYGARVAYEPFTLRRGAVASEETIRRWRSGLFVNPDRWPRLSYDFTRSKTDRHSEGISHDDWDSYVLSWQPGSNAISSSYARQVRTAPDTVGEVLETYRASVSSDRPLPYQGHFGLAYNYDRSWRERLGSNASALDQHTPSVFLTAQPVSWIGWNAQYTGRYRVRRDPQLTGPDHTQDQMATGTLTLTPVSGFSVVGLRYYDKTAEVGAAGGQSSDYWQVRASRDGRLFRQVRGLFTAYRIVYVGQPEGKKYSDAFFASLRGRVHRHAELSAEGSLADLHGTQPDRYAANANIYSRLSPTVTSQIQVGYSLQALAHERGNFDIANENITVNTQWYPDPNISFSGGTTVGRNRLLSSAWTTAWTAAASYRWPSFANISVNYNRRDRQKLLAAGAQAAVAATKTLLIDGVWWVNPSTTVTVSWSRRQGQALATGDQWSVGLATQF